jgi:hypothetical protein
MAFSDFAFTSLFCVVEVSSFMGVLFVFISGLLVDAFEVVVLDDALVLFVQLASCLG